MTINQFPSNGHHGRQTSTPSFTAEHNEYGMGYPIEQFRSAALAVLPPGLLLTPSLLTEGQTE